MKKLLPFLLCVLWLPLSLFGQNVDREITERNRLVSDYEKNRHLHIEDSLSEKASWLIDRLEEILEKDNLIIDVFQDNYAHSREDSLTIARLREEVQALGDTDGSLSALEPYLLYIAGMVAFLILLFLVMWIVYAGKSRVIRKKYIIEKQLSEKNAAENEKLKYAVKNAEQASKEEYERLKELTEQEMQHQQAVIRELHNQIEELKIEMENTLTDLRDALELKGSVENELRKMIAEKNQ